MILKLMIALVRWTWGVTPAFYTPDPPLTEGMAFVMLFGAMLDVVCVVVAVATLDDWLRERRARRKKARERKERVLDGLREFGASLDRIGERVRGREKGEE